MTLGSQRVDGLLCVGAQLGTQREDAGHFFVDDDINERKPVFRCALPRVIEDRRDRQLLHGRHEALAANLDATPCDLHVHRAHV